MSILKTLATMQENRQYVMTLRNIALLVGESDRNAAKLLMPFIEQLPDDILFEDAEVLLLGEWAQQLADVINGKPKSDALKDPNVRAAWDAIFWFRFLVALRTEESEPQP